MIFRAYKEQKINQKSINFKNQKFKIHETKY